MSSANLIRLGALAAVVGSVLSIIGDLVGLLVDFENMAVAATTTSYALTFWLYLLASVLILIGLVALYVRQSEEAGILGLVGFLVAFFGTALLVGVAWAQVFIGPFLAIEAPEIFDLEPPGFLLTFGLLSLGWVLFGIATLLARVYSRWVAVLLIVGSVIVFVPVPLSGIVQSVAVGWLGIELLRERGVSVEQPARVR